jgi:hypothetical protein
MADEITKWPTQSTLQGNINSRKWFSGHIVLSAIAGHTKKGEGCLASLTNHSLQLILLHDDLSYYCNIKL